MAISNDSIIFSRNAKYWISVLNIPDHNLNHITFGNNLFFTVGGDLYASGYLITLDGENSNETVNLEYISHLNDNSMSELLNQNLEIDKISKSTTHGPHKDDISLIMDNRLIKKFGSQGQQKTFLVSLKLAQFELLEKINNIKPILLLDDIFDKLDNNRVEELLSLVDKGFFSQVFITDTSEKRCNELLKKLRTNYIIFSL